MLSQFLNLMYQFVVFCIKSVYKVVFSVFSAIFGKKASFFSHAFALVMVFAIGICALASLGKGCSNSKPKGTAFAAASEENNPYYELPVPDKTKLLNLAEIVDCSAATKKQEALMRKGYTVLRSTTDCGKWFTCKALHKNNSIFVIFTGKSDITDYLVGTRLSLSSEEFAALLPLQDATKYVRDVMEKHPQHNVFAMGYSMGGILVQHVLSSYPDSRLWGLAINSPGVPGLNNPARNPHMIEIVHEADPARSIFSSNHVSSKVVEVLGSYSKNDKGIWVADFDKNNSIPQHSISLTISNMKKQSRKDFVAPINKNEGSGGGLRLPGGARSFSELLGDTLR